MGDRWVSSHGRILVVLLLTSACTHQAPVHHDRPSAVDPRGTGARIAFEEMALHAALGTVVFLGIMALLVAIVRRHRRGVAVPVPDDVERRGTRWIVLGGIVLPVVVLSVIATSSFLNMVDLGSPPDPETVLVEVTGHQWWWQVDYPDEGITTANEIRVPVGESIRLELRSDDVIHSFWVPQVQRKMDLVPGQTNTLWIDVDEPGIYRGVCAEFCGLQHARMHFRLIAMPEDRWHQWIDDRRGGAPEPSTELEQRGHDVFMSSSCVHCHTIEGTAAAGTVGPDLTDLADRLTIAGGTYRNNPGNLSGWIVDPQHMKPGAQMPPADLTGDELEALRAYLGILR